MGAWHVTSQVLQLVYCVIGLMGNVLCLAVFSRKSLRSSFVALVIGLAVCDSLVLIKGLLSGLKVLEVVDLVDYSSVPAILFRWMCDLGAKYFVVVIAADRYFAVRYPLRWRDERRGLVLAGGVVVFVGVMTVVSFLIATYVSQWELIYKSILLSFVPFLLVVLFSVGIGHAIWKGNKKKDALGSTRKDLSATKMLLAVTTFFGICCFFEATRRILIFSGYYETEKYGFYDYTISHLSDHAYLLNSAANPVIYGLMSKRFRVEVWRMFRCPGLATQWTSSRTAESPTDMTTSRSTIIS